jgi:ATP diphosphatase
MTDITDKPDDPVEKLLWVMARLRDPKDGCPWDVEQTFASIVPHTIEEAYEVADAIESEDWNAIPDEIGDLLFQVVFYAQMAKEDGRFDFHRIADGIAEKMIFRHPHVFGGEETPDSADAQVSAWEALKAKERRDKGGEEETQGPKSALDGVARGLPALTRALKLQKRAARVGFDWDDADGALAKLDEETAEVRAEMDAGAAPERLEDEIGDLLFTCVNLARKLDVDPEQALRRSSKKFESRFRTMEGALDKEGKAVDGSTADELDRRWNAAKAAL